MLRVLEWDVRCSGVHILMAQVYFLVNGNQGFVCSTESSHQKRLRIELQLRSVQDIIQRLSPQIPLPIVAVRNHTHIH